MHRVLLDVDVEDKWRTGHPILRVALTQRGQASRRATLYHLLSVRRPTDLVVTQVVKLSDEVRVSLFGLDVSIPRLQKYRTGSLVQYSKT